MATQTLAALDAILKDEYVGPIVEELNQKTYLIDQIERDADHIDHTGRRAVFPVHKNRNRGRRSIADGGELPPAGGQVYLDGIVPMRYHFLGIELTDQVIEATKSNEGAFISGLVAETKGAAIDLRKDLNRQCFGRGNGTLASAPTSSSGLLKTSGSATKTKLDFVTEFDLQYIEIGDIIDVLKEATGETANGVVGAEVTARSVSSKEVTLSKALSAELAAETYNAYVSKNRNNEMDGLRNMIETKRTLHSINSETAGNTFWDAQKVEAGTSLEKTAVAGQSLFEQVADKVGAQGNGDVEVFLTTRGVRRKLADTYESQKRFNDANAVDIHGGYSAIMVNEIPVVADDQCPKTFAFGFNKSALKWFEQVKPSWFEMENGIFQLKPGSTAGTWNAVWQAWMKWYAVFGNVAPNRCGRIEFCSDEAPI